MKKDYKMLISFYLHWHCEQNTAGPYTAQSCILFGHYKAKVEIECLRLSIHSQSCYSPHHFLLL